MSIKDGFHYLNKEDLSEFTEYWGTDFEDMLVAGSRTRNRLERYIPESENFAIRFLITALVNDFKLPCVRYTLAIAVTMYSKRHKLEILEYLGIKKSNSVDRIKYKELLHTRHIYMNKYSLRRAIAKVVNATFEIRDPKIWGESTTAYASDSTQIGAWDQNLIAEWHARYKGRGVMIYWHVEKKSTCIYSQLKRCSSSEVASMIEGVLRHCTEMSVNKTYVDSHGQSEVGFAYCHMLGFNLMPRLKNVASQKLYVPDVGLSGQFDNIELILTRPIDWKIIAEQYDQIIKYSTALKHGTTDPESILRRFTRNNIQHPTYKALAELGKVN